MKKFLALATILLATLILYAQSHGKITGLVIDGNQKTIESATVALLKTSDSSTVKFAVAGKEGRFQFEDIANGKYLVSVTAVGHEKGYSAAFEIKKGGENIQLPIINLEPASKAMSAVVVTAKKPFIEHKIDRTVVNVDASPTNAGNTAMEVLEKSPGVSVDRDGNISLKGKDGVLVLIDGRPTQLSNADLANMLRSLNASQLEQIEIMTNPPAKYDAAGTGGVIDIKTKKIRQFGYNGSVSANYGQGMLPKVDETLNFNYRQNKWNLFTNLSHGYRERSQQLFINRNFIDEGTKLIVSNFDQEARMKNQGTSFNAKFGADYFASNKTTVGVVISGFSNDATHTNNNTTLISQNSSKKVTNALSRQDRQFDNFSTNLNFRQVIDTSGRELTGDFDFITYDGKSNLSLSNYYFDLQGHELFDGDTLYGRLPQQIDIYSGKLDFTRPLQKGSRFDAGIKSSFVRTDANAIYDTVFNGVIIRDRNRSNHFLYEENINAAYANISGPLGKKFSGQFGLRVENTIAKGNQVTTGQTFSRNYTQLFPTAYLQYTINEKNNLVVNYGRRIRRPNYRSLNPFIEYLDRYTYQQGNPNLKPQFSHNIELTHSYRGFLNTTLNYSKTNDIIQQVLEQIDSTNQTFVKQSNIANQRQFGLSVSANVPVTKWWRSNLYVNVFNSRFEGLINNTQVSIAATTLNLNGSQQFTITKTLTVEASGWFRSGSVEGVFQSRSMGGLNIGFSQQVMKGKGTIRLNMQDVLWTQRFRANSKYGTVDVKVQEQGDSRVVNLGFTYRFSKGKVSPPKRRSNGSASDEQNRIGG